MGLKKCKQGTGYPPGAKLEHLAETTEGQNRGGKGQGRSGLDNGEIAK